MEIGITIKFNTFKYYVNLKKLNLHNINSL